MKQVESGKSFEYGIAYQLQEITESKLVENVYLQKARGYFEKCNNEEKNKITRAAKEVVLFLTAEDVRIKQKKCVVRLQSDQEGGKGDVRDVIIETPSGEVGISAKNRHFAVKNPRLSEHIDFGSKWLGCSVSQYYWDTVKPIFREMRSMCESGQQWRDVPDKEDRFYVPILSAFNLELERIYNIDKDNVAKGLLHYLLGRYDFYKVTKENGTATVQSFNINGDLKWGKKLPMPTAIDKVRNKTKATTIYTFDKGWQISFRIHNAESKVTPSLKFDVQLVGLPHNLSRHEIGYLY